MYRCKHTGKLYLNGVRYSEEAYDILSNPSKITRPFILKRDDDNVWSVVWVRPVFSEESNER